MANEPAFPFFGRRKRFKISPAETKRKKKFVALAKELRPVLGRAKYAVIAASGEFHAAFEEFSGVGEAKACLDESDLPPGSVVIRLKDGVEMSRRSQIALDAS